MAVITSAPRRVACGSRSRTGRDRTRRHSAHQFVHGQDAAPEPVSGFEELKVRACLPHQARRIEAGKPTADDGHLRIGQLGSSSLTRKSKVRCGQYSTCLRVSDAEIADQVTVDFGEQVGVRLVGKGVAEISRSHFADPLAVLVLVIDHRGHDHLRHE